MAPSASSTPLCAEISASGQVHHYFAEGANLISVQHTQTGCDPQASSSAHRSFLNWFYRFRSYLYALFYAALLPDGYPNSVSPDYTSYQIWDTAQALCSTITGMLSTRAVLRGVGVGDTSATATAATLQWVCRDGVSMVSRIAFASFQGSDLDYNAKVWRLAADITNDMAMLIEILTTHMPLTYFLPMACAAAALRAVTAVAGGATRAALTQHFAIQQNMGDVSAKDGSQETAVNLIGTLLATFLVTREGSESALFTWALFAFFTALHLFSNYCLPSQCVDSAVRSVVLHHLNRQRADIVLDSFLKEKKMLTPNQASHLEGVTPFTRVRGERIAMGVPLAHLTASVSRFKELLAIHAADAYLCECNGSSRKIKVALAKNCPATDQLKAYVQATLLLTGRCAKVEDAHQLATKLLPDLLHALTTLGWDISRTALGGSLHRIEWKLD